MRINPYQPVGLNPIAPRKSVKETAKVAESVPKDNSSISPEALFRSKLESAMNVSSPERTKKIENLRSLIEQGKYSAPSLDIAEKMLRSR